MNKKECHILNLGAGTQSTALYLLDLQGKLQHYADWTAPDGQVFKEPEPIKLDCAIFADTGEEPRAVYHHLQWMKSLNGAPILEGSVGKLGDDLIHGRNSAGQSFASIPAFTLAHALVASGDYDDRDVGKTRRQCTKEYKIDAVERTIRREVLGLSKGQRIPRDVKIYQYIGYSAEEGKRVIKARMRAPWWCEMRFPLYDSGTTRKGTINWIRTYGNVPHEVPRSACVFCPFHDEEEWLAIKNDPDDWARATEIDRALRSNALAAKDMKGQLFLHRSARPLEEIDFAAIVEDKEKVKKQQQEWGFVHQCEGACGL